MGRAHLALVLLLVVAARAAPQTADRRPRSVPNAADSKFGPQIVFPLQQSFKHPASLFKKREATVNIGLPVISPPIWTANVGLGTPAQSVAVLLDTGSANLAVTPPPGNACSGCATNAVDAFDATKSSTWAQVGCGTARCTRTSCTTCTTGQQCNMALNYADGSTLQGLVGLDAFELGGYSIPNATYGTITSISADFFGKDPNSPTVGGIMGLAFGSLSCWRDPPPIQLLLQYTPALYKGFTFCLQRGGGSWIIGEDYTTSAVAYDWADLDPTANHYSSYFAGISVNNALLQGITATDYTEQQIIFDTGSTLNYLTPTLWTALSNTLIDACTSAGFSFSQCSKLFADVIDSGFCYAISQDLLDSLPDVQLTFQYNGGSIATATLPPSVYLRPCSSSAFWGFSFSKSTQTSLTFQPNIIGSSMLQYFRVAFDIQQMRIGFAAPTTCAGFSGYPTVSSSSGAATLCLSLMLLVASAFLVLG